MLAETRRRSAWGLAVAVICLSIFVIGLWEPLWDGIDSHFPTRHEVRNGAQPTTWDVRSTVGPGQSRAVREALGVLPPAYQRLVQQHEGKLLVTNRAALARLSPLASNHLTYTAGLYVPATKQVYVAYDSSNSGRTALHEMGHLVDHALSYPSRKPQFQAIFAAVEADNRLGSYPRSHPQELFAELFAKYYFSDRQRAHVTAWFPQAASYFRVLEGKIVTDYGG